MNTAEHSLADERLIGKGLTSQVYSWGPNRVLKLAESWRPRWKIEAEFAITKAVHDAGVPAPDAFELIEINGRLGIVFERIEGPSMIKIAQEKPWRIFWGARQLAELHRTVHSFKAPDVLPSKREQIEYWLSMAADFSPEERAATEECLARLPAGDALLHGDFHPANILFTSHGPIIIDWSGATRGHIYCDVARTSQLFGYADLPPEVSLSMRIIFAFARRLLHRTYLRHYLKLSGGSMRDVDLCRPAERAGSSAWRNGRKM